MDMNKEKSSSEVYPAGDADSDALRAKNVVCDQPHFSSTQCDNSVRINNAVACSSGSSENNLASATSNNASKDEMLLESNAREPFIEEQLSSKLAHPSRENLAYNKRIGSSKDEVVSASSAAGTCNHQQKVHGVIDQVPSCSLDLGIDAALDAADPLLEMKVICVGSNSLASTKGQTVENDVDGKQLIDSSISLDPDEKVQFVDVKKHRLIAQLESEGDDADLEEQDVKVCDICGDAGREDLLAICSRCSDGAEHTYCMHEMLDEVPEGGWLCEECKSYEEMERRKQGRSEILGAKERSKRNLGSFPEKKDPSLAGTRTNNDSLTRRLTNKRRGSDIEVDSAAKKQFLESMVQSPTKSSPRRDGALFRDNSCNSRDDMSAKLTHQPSISGRDRLEKSRLPNASVSNVAKGSYLKSNSFGASSSLPKVKMVVEIPQNHKHCVDLKDGSSKIVSKSVSLKGNLSRSNTTELNGKMLSTKDSHILESRALKQAKDLYLFERKKSIKLDHSADSQLAVNGCKNQLRGVNRRQQSSYLSGEGSSSTDGASGSADAKSSLSNKEGCSSSFSPLDGNSSEKNLDRSSNYFRQCVGDAALQSSALDTSSVRSLKDGMNEENKLKAAIQAAMQKRLDMVKESKGRDKSNVLSVPNVDSVGEKSALDRPNSLKNSVPTEGMHVAEAASPKCSIKSIEETSVNNVNPSKVLQSDSVDFFQAKNMDSVFSYPEQILRRSAIPDLEFAWIGSFEVYRGENTPEQISGVQAHLSTCASYKVLEMVKKFPQKVSLSEVPRSCIWPAQFRDAGAEEDNIAVYFFAKDVESYERSYKNLLEKMMKDDLALKGNIDGIDLLIFPSKQLTKKSQRWNTLFFIWGVFRGKKENFLDNNSGYVSTLSTCKAVPSDFRFSPEKPSLDGHAKENLSTTKSEQDLWGHNSFDTGVVLRKESPRFSNEDHYEGKHSEHKTVYLMKKFGHHAGASSGTTYKSTLVQVDSCIRDAVKAAECQATISCTEGYGDSSIKLEMMLGNLSSAEKTFFVSRFSENETEVKVKDEKEEEAIVKDGGCPMKLGSTLKKEETCGDAVNYQAKLMMECKLKQDEVKKIEFGGKYGHDGPTFITAAACLEEQAVNDSNDMHSPTSAAIEKRCKVVSNKEAERLLFPAINSSTSIKSRDDTLKVADGFLNLKLALGIENRTTESGFCLELADDRVVTRKEDEETSAAAPSVPLAFPFGERH